MLSTQTNFSIYLSRPRRHGGLYEETSTAFAIGHAVEHYPYHYGWMWQLKYHHRKGLYQ